MTSDERRRRRERAGARGRGGRPSSRAIGVALTAFAIALGACANVVGVNFDEYSARVDAGVSADAATCPPGQTDCAGSCVDLGSSPSHCGKCGIACADDPHGAGVCVSAHCAFVCDQGWEECAGGCCNGSEEAGTDGGPSDEGGAEEGGIACGPSAYCAVDSNSFCCVEPSGDYCATVAADNDCDTEIFCTTAAQCPGDSICCYDPDQGESDCEEGCSDGQTQLCQPGSGECNDGTDCTGKLPGTSYPACQ